jgi:ADP-ribosyl-[dinitrogen reductase] hydrolase
MTELSTLFQLPTPVTWNRSASLSSVFDRALGAYLGLAIGDALGATVEFMTPNEIRLRHGVHRDIIGGGWLKLAAGQVTDDTTMSLALGEALLDGARAGGFETRFVAERFVAWWRGRPVDCGNTCRRGIQRYVANGTLAGPPSDGDGGNGALMRNLPVVLATLRDDDAFVAQSLAQAHVTHNHPLSDAATLGLGEMTRALILGGDPGVKEVEPPVDPAGTAPGARVGASRRIADALVAACPVFRYNPYPGRASGYVVDTVQTVLHSYFSHSRFEDAVITAVNRGDDADTTGALVGMLAGARCGALALPSEWTRRLDRQVVRAITEQTSALLALAQNPDRHPSSPASAATATRSARPTEALDG